ncbi:MAG: hypothetical protein AABY15_04960 [Nanoarchaeota archaeon]
MDDLNAEKFAEIYIESALKILKRNNSLDISYFYRYVFADVSKITGFSEDKIKYLHHAFHWTLFLGKNSSFELIPIQNKEEENYRIRFRNGIPEKSELIAIVLREHKEWLELRFQKLKKI